MRIGIGSLVVSVTLLVPAAIQAQTPQPREALDGVDAVILLTQGKEVMGKPEFKVTRGKFDYLFANAGSRATFERNPEKYEIQLSGACARMGGGVTGNPADYAVVDGRIYIFGSDDCHTSSALSHRRRCSFISCTSASSTGRSGTAAFRRCTGLP